MLLVIDDYQHPLTIKNMEMIFYPIIFRFSHLDEDHHANRLVKIPLKKLK
jgi:hypothetical protein